VTPSRVIAVIAFAGLLGSRPCAAFGDASISPNANASRLCQTLHETARPALTALLKNDSLFETANRALATADRITLRSVTGDLTGNLNMASQLLGHGFTADANAAARDQEQLMKVRLDAVAAAQNDALNVIEGYAQTRDIAQARDEFPGGRSENAVEVLPYDNPTGTGSDFQNPKDPATAVTGPNQGRLEGPAAILQMTRSRISQLEDSAGVAIMSVVQVCNHQ
jgi:hypothetical protein